MSDERGLLGSLPKTRPGVRSPRRAAAQAGATRPASSVAEPAESSTSGFEDLARAGVGLAGGAAALGLRLAGRAAGELGKAVGRR